MKLKDFLKTLNRIVKDNPEYNELDVVYSSDDEGNSYHGVFQTGSLARFENLKEYYLEIMDEDETTSPNAIIIN